MTTPEPAGSRFLAPAVVAGLGTLELKARTIVEGLLLGMHRSPYRGFSAEFAEYRPYLPGDDLALVDWKLYARTDRHFVRTFEQETNLECHLLVDVSASMGYGGGNGMTKLEYASCLAASMAWLLGGQHDAVGLVTFDHRIVDRVRPAARTAQIRSILLALERARAAGVSDTAAALGAVAGSLRKRGLVMVFSDLLSEPARVVQALKQLRSRRSEVVAFQVLDNDELTFPFERATRFHDVETDDEVLTEPSRVRDEYLTQMGEFRAQYERELRSAGIDYRLVDTSQPLDLTLLAYVTSRSRAWRF
jgi:uncharacterized protein (DUF58 family)